MHAGRFKCNKHHQQKNKQETLKSLLRAQQPIIDSHAISHAICHCPACLLSSPHSAHMRGWPELSVHAAL